MSPTWLYWPLILPSGTVSATGGTVTDVDGYRYHTFTSSGTFDVTAGGDVEVLIVGGGGAGGIRFTGGGGGGGGEVVIQNTTVSSNAYTITVGSSVAGTLGSNGNGNGSQGNASSIVGAGVDITADGGGGGLGLFVNTGGSSGSGTSGGTGIDVSIAGGGGGGGGDSAAGANCTVPDGVNGEGGDGGNGTEWPSGSGNYYGGGGGGGLRGGTGSPGSGGLGGGGDGGRSDAGGAVLINPQSGTANTGGGGGGSRSQQSGDGGSGIVIVRYPLSAAVLWTPLDDSALAGWFDASDTSTLFDAPTGGGTVSINDGAVLRWENKAPLEASPRLPDLVGSDSGTIRKYRYVADYVNGLGCVGGNGIDRPIESNFTKIWPFTMYIVAAVDANFTGVRFVINLSGSSGSNSGPGQVSGQGASSYWQYFNQTQSETNVWAAVNEPLASPVAKSSNLTLHAVRSINGALREPECVAYSVNGGSTVFGLRQAAPTGATAQMADAIAQLGGRSDLSVPSGTRICEIIITPTTDLATQAKYEGYLAHKWGLQGNLPVDHPYKSSPPPAP